MSDKKMFYYCRLDIIQAFCSLYILLLYTFYKQVFCYQVFCYLTICYGAFFFQQFCYKTFCQQTFLLLDILLPDILLPDILSLGILLLSMFLQDIFLLDILLLCILILDIFFTRHNVRAFITLCILTTFVVVVRQVVAERQNHRTKCLFVYCPMERQNNQIFVVKAEKPDNISNGQADNWTILLAMFRDRLGLDQFSEELIDTCLGIFLVNDFEINNSVSSPLIKINKE